MEKTIIIKIVNKSQNPLPAYQTSGAAGMDICANEDVTLKMGEISLVSTGLYMQIPPGYEAQIRCRSGLALKYGVALVNGIGTIDSDYRGEIKIIMTVLKSTPFAIKKGDRIAQVVFARYVQADVVCVETLEDTVRSSGGFGSSGIR
jgi:dUTP pyrophosphatase